MQVRQEKRQDVNQEGRHRKEQMGKWLTPPTRKPRQAGGEVIKQRTTSTQSSETWREAPPTKRRESNLQTETAQMTPTDKNPNDNIAVTNGVLKHEEDLIDARDPSWPAFNKYAVKDFVWNTWFDGNWFSHGNYWNYHLGLVNTKTLGEDMHGGNIDTEGQRDWYLGGERWPDWDYDGWNVYKINHYGPFSQEL